MKQSTAHELYADEEHTDAFPLEAANAPLWREMFAGVEWLSLRASPIYYGFGATRGDGSPVVLVPGCFGTDSYLVELHGWLRRIGYRPYFSGIGLNIQCPNVMVERLLQTVERAHRESGRKVRIIGHSLGGLLARGVALRRPELVEQVITVGSPVRGLAVHPKVLAAARLVGGNCLDDCVSPLQVPLPGGVPETSIYSRSDSVVGWRSCMRDDDGTAVEVHGTHVGLVFNPEVYRAMSRILANRIIDGTSAPSSPPRLRLVRSCGCAGSAESNLERTVA